MLLKAAHFSDEMGNITNSILAEFFKSVIFFLNEIHVVVDIIVMEHWHITMM